MKLKTLSKSIVSITLATVIVAPSFGANGLTSPGTFQSVEAAKDSDPGMYETKPSMFQSNKKAMLNETALGSVTIDDVEYLAYADGTAKVKDYVKVYDGTSNEVVTIPEEIVFEGDTYVVTVIGDKSFFDKYGVTKVNIPNTVKILETEAFYYSNITEMHIPASVTTIGDGALVNLHIETLTVDPSNPEFTSENNILYNKAKTTLIRYAPKKPDNTFKIPDHVTILGPGSFMDSKNINTIQMNDNVTTIGDSAFYSCHFLKNVDIPKNVTSIGMRSFRFCEGLETINAYPLEAPTTDYNTFTGVPATATLYTEQSATGYDISPWTDFKQAKFGNPLTGISLSGPAKKDYLVGEELDTTGLVVTGTYSDGSTSTIPSTGYTISGFDSSSAVSGQTITVKVNDEAASFKVNIAAKPVKEKFTDIDGHWASSYITQLQNKGLVTGYEDGTFRPQGLVTREESAQMLSEYVGGSADPSVEVPSDSLDSWSTEAIRNLIGKNIITGYEDGTFRPKNNITRAEFATLVHNIFSDEGKLEPTTKSLSDLSGHWAKEYIEKLAGNEIINGYEDGTFRPQNNITRAEAAAIIALADDK